MMPAPEEDWRLCTMITGRFHLEVFYREEDIAPSVEAPEVIQEANPEDKTDDQDSAPAIPEEIVSSETASSENQSARPGPTAVIAIHIQRGDDHSGEKLLQFEFRMFSTQDETAEILWSVISIEMGSLTSLHKVYKWRASYVRRRAQTDQDNTALFPGKRLSIIWSKVQSSKSCAKSLYHSSPSLDSK